MIIGLGAALVEGAAVTTRTSICGSSTRWPRRSRTPLATPVDFSSRVSGCSPCVRRRRLRTARYRLEGQRTPSFADELEHANEREIDGIAIRVLGLERILTSKKAAGRPKDLAAIPALEAALAAKAARSK